MALAEIPGIGYKDGPAVKWLRPVGWSETALTESVTNAILIEKLTDKSFY